MKAVAVKGNSRKEKPREQSLWKRVGLPLLLILAGLAILLYPVVATQVNNYSQNRAAEQYAESVKNSDPATAQRFADALESAHRYNESHVSGPVLDPWLARVSPDNAEYQAYLQELNGLPSMSQLVIPSIDVNLPIFHGTEEKTLQKGVGHLFGSSLPVGGPGTHSVLSAHTGLTNATLFDNLDKVKKGDAVYVSTFGENMKYEVDSTEVVLPNEANGLTPTPGEDRITLITCTPYGVNSHRLLVHAHRVPMDPEEGQVFSDGASIWQWWMWILLAVALLTIAALIWWILNERKKLQQSTAAGVGAAAPVKKGRHRR